MRFDQQITCVPVRVYACVPSSLAHCLLNMILFSYGRICAGDFCKAIKLEKKSHSKYLLIPKRVQAGDALTFNVKMNEYGLWYFSCG